MNKILNEAVKSVGLLSQAKVIFLMDPLLEQMATQFAEYVGTQSLASNNKPLLSVAVKEAITNYNALGEDNPKQAFSAFVRTLIDQGAEVFAQRIYVKTDQGEIMWSPFVSSVTEFLSKYPNAEIVAERGESKFALELSKTFMMTKIIPVSLLDQESLSEILNDFSVRV